MTFTIRKKLAVLTVLAFIATVVVVWEARTSIEDLSSASATLVDNAGRLSSFATVDMMHDAIRSDVLTTILATTTEERGQTRAAHATHAKAIRASLTEVQRGQPADSAFVRTMATIDATIDRYLAEATRVIDLAATNPDAARLERAPFELAFRELEEALGRGREALEREARVEQLGSSETATRRLMLSALISAVVLSLLGWFIARSITRRLAHVDDILGRVAGGDFARRTDDEGRDEIGRMCGSLNRALGSVDRAFGEVRQVAVEMTRASGALATSSDTISTGAQQQAASLEETAASLEQITAAVKQSASNAHQASQLASGAREIAEDGGRVMSEAIAAMAEVTEASRKIGEIITTIDEIALQTNLLALNAAVEAARAGEHGRGFAVVAAGVGDLAQRSAAAAKEVKGLIHNALRRVESSNVLVDRSSMALRDIIVSVKKVTDFFGEIAAAAREQSSGVEQVNEAVAEMDRVTQANSAQTHDLTGMAESLSLKARHLGTLLAAFTMTSTTQTRVEPEVPAPIPSAPRRRLRTPPAALHDDPAFEVL